MPRHPHLFPSNWRRKLLQALGPKSLLVWGVLLVALVSAIYGLTDVVRGLEFGFAFGVMVIAATGGWLLGILPLKDHVSAFAGAFLGVEFVFVRVGRLEDEVFRIFAAVFTLFGQIVAWLWAWLRALAEMVYTRTPLSAPSPVVDWAHLPDAYVTLWTALGTLCERSGRWLAALLQGSGAYDPIAIALIWGLMVWACAWWAGWLVNRRQQPLAAILPGGVLVSFLLAYTWASTFVLLPLIGFTFLLMALVGHRARERRWAAQETDYSLDLWSDLAWISAAVSLGLVMVAALSPLVTMERLQEITEWVEGLTEREAAPGEPLAESLGIQQKPPREVTPIEHAQTTSLPRRHLIGSGPELSQIVVMLVRTHEVPEIPEEILMDTAGIVVPRHYWRSITYDRYYGRGWATSPTSLAHYAAGELARVPEQPFHQLLRQEVQMIGPRDGAIYVDGLLIAADQPFEGYWRTSEDLFAATVKEAEYRADSLMLDVTEADLRNAVGLTPDWVVERYTQLPEELPSRVRDLAFELTATEPTMYDRAKAIEGYVRHFSYTLDVPMPGLTEDIADYFLFELQMGYCDYYATAMVVLARAAGLPARLVVGYASGDYQFRTGRYVVTEADAHAWVEIYFPGIGWVEFEPTGGYPEIARGAAEFENETSPPPDWEHLEPLVPPPDPQEVLTQAGLWVLRVCGGALGTLLLLTGADALFLLGWGQPAGAVTRLYHRLRRHRRGLGARVCVGDTPYEVGASLARRLDELAVGHDVGRRLLTPATGEIQRLIEFYVQAWYTPRPLMFPARLAVVGTWWVLRWRLWLARLLFHPRRPRHPIPVPVRESRQVKKSR